jgi:hypothetical protein
MASVFGRWSPVLKTVWSLFKSRRQFDTEESGTPVATRNAQTISEAPAVISCRPLFGSCSRNMSTDGGRCCTRCTLSAKFGRLWGRLVFPVETLMNTNFISDAFGITPKIGITAVSRRPTSLQRAAGSDVGGALFANKFRTTASELVCPLYTPLKRAKTGDKSSLMWPYWR